MGGSDRLFCRGTVMLIIKKIRKWSKRYKNSINCKHPKGFSQKQHCKYGKKVVSPKKKKKLLSVAVVGEIGIW